MKKTFTFVLALAAVASATATYTSDGSKKAYTFEQLSKIDTSGVVKVGNAYYVNEEIEIADGDTLRLQSGDVVKLGHGVRVSIDGFADFAPADTAYVTRDSASSAPKGFRIYGDNASAVLRNVTIEYAGVAFGSSTGSIKVDNCTFSKYNGKLNSSAALSFSRSSVGNTVTNSRFIGSYSAAIGNGANTPIGISITNCYFFRNDTSNANRPQINLTCAGSSSAYDVTISNNRVIGGKFTKSGGIGVSNMLSIAHSNKVTISNNEVRDNRYGVTVIGPVDVTINGNDLVDNCYETDANNGGSGISIYSNSASSVVSNNLIEGNLWGVTLIGASKNMNFGKTGDPTSADYNPGNNVFRNNGNNNVLYDLYNNTTDTVYAQGNTWNVATQDSVSIEEVVFHKADNSSLGLVIFMPAKTPTGITAAKVSSPAVQYCPAIEAVVLNEPAAVTVYSVTGQQAAASNGAVGALSVADLAPGVYVARTAAAAVKFVKK